MKLTTQLSALSMAATLMLAGCSDSTPGETTAPPPPETPKFSVDVSVDKAVVMQGQTLSMKAIVTRSAGFIDAVQVQIGGLPDGVSAPAVMIPAGASEADVLLTAIGAAPHSLPTAVNARGTAGNATANKAFTVTVRGAAGVVDTSFAGGTVITPVDISEDYANAVAVQADGKVIVAGSSATINGTHVSLVRYLRDGSLDTTFGNGGKVVTVVGSSDMAAAVAVQRDGRIVVAGSSDQGASGLDIAVLRYNADGTLDATFGNGGVRLVDFVGGTDRAWALLIQGDDKIVVGGEAGIGGATTGVDFALVRLNANGSLDAGFGTGGKVSTAIKSGTGTEIVRALAIQPVAGENRILAVGGEGDFVAARYSPNGALDAGFGNGGKVTDLFGDIIGSARAVTVLPTGEAVLAGHIGHQFAVAQLTPAGQLDNRFGAQGSGRFRFSVVNNWNEATALARQADGKFVVGGWAYSGNGSSGDFAAIRITAQGALDGSFGSAGVTLTPTAAGTKDDQSHGLVLQADDRVPAVRAIQAGEANGSNHDFALLRLWL